MIAFFKGTMRFHTRAFLFSFIPFALLLVASFLIVQMLVEATVRAGLRDSLRETQKTVRVLRDLNRVQIQHFLETAGQDQEVKEKVSVLVAEEGHLAAQRTLQDQPGMAAASVPDADKSDIAAQGALADHGLTETSNVLAVDKGDVAVQGVLADQEGTGTASVSGADQSDVTAKSALEDRLQALVRHSGIDFMLVTGGDGEPVAGVVRAGSTSEFDPLYAFPQMEDGGLLLFRGEPFQTVAVDMDQNGIKVGSMIVGMHLDLSKFATSTVLMHGGYALQSDIHEGMVEIGNGLSACPTDGECRVQLSGEEWMSLPILAGSREGSERVGWTLYSLVNVEWSLKPVERLLDRTFLTVLILAFVSTLICSLMFSRAIVRPLAVLVSHLREAAATGTITELEDAASPVLEIEELASSYNRAASSVKEGRKRLQSAYVEFVYSMARALDARDRYTAGHSERVSNLSCALATAMGEDEENVERIRIGALLHDIGKIGISDMVLQKPGRLTEDEVKTIQKHPVIGRRILKGVQGFAPYLAAVELHHENWDGSGYPNRLLGPETPLDARIIHVADAYDAMTTNRSYRKAMTHERAMEILAECAGTEFDPEVVLALERTLGEQTGNFFSKDVPASMPPSVQTTTGTVVATANMDVPHLLQ